MVPTLFGILLISFVIVQFAPGGPVERVISQLQNPNSGSAADRVGGGQGGDAGAQTGGDSSYRGAQGLDPAFIKELEKQFGFDKPAHERFVKMLGDYAASISAAAISAMRRCCS
jgi:microcin C transport system permease protein